MTWLTWRQHRAETLTIGLVVAALGVLLLAVGLPMHTAFDDTIAGCLVPPAPETCGDARTLFLQKYGDTTATLAPLTAVPFAIGAFLGAPLIARELESGTLYLAWTQAVPRMRWLAVKLSALVLVTVVLSGVFAVVVTWFRQPLDTLYGPFAPGGFDIEGLMPPVYALFAFALATAAGVFLRRSLPALAAALVAFVVARVAVASWLRPHYLEPRILVEPLPDNPRGIQIGGTSRTDWVLDLGFADAGGRRLSPAEVDELDTAARDAGASLAAYLHDHDIQRWVSYHPADRFWTFQYLEAATFLGLAAILLGVVIWRIRRRAL
jgi:hypothetical protein